MDRRDSVLGNSTKDFEVVKELGKGSYGTVFLVRLRKDPAKLDGTQRGSFSNTNLMNSTQGFGQGTSGSGADYGMFGSTKQSTTELQQTNVFSAHSTKKEPPLYVLKKIPMKDIKPKMQLAAVREATIMSELDHPNVVRFYTSFLENDCLYILMEYAQRGDLYKMLRE